MGIMVDTILDLLYNASVIQIYYDGWTYEFNISELPDEIRYMPVQSIDDPYYHSYVHALCLNIDAEGIDNPDDFYEQYKDYAI